MEQKIATRMGDGSLVEMTRSEIKADLEEGTQIAAKKAKVPELTQDELDHLLDIYASSARFTAVDIGDEVVLSQRRHRDQVHRQRRHGPPGLRAGRRRRHRRALADRLLVQGRQDQRPPRGPVDEDGPDAAHQPGAVRRHARPGPLLGARRALPELVRAAAAGQDRRGAPLAGGGGGDARARHRVRRRPSRRGRRRRHRHGHDRRRRRLRLPRRPAGVREAARQVPRPRHRDRHGRRVRDRHARPDHPRRHAPRGALAQGAARARPEGGGEHLRALRQHQHRQVDRVERRPARSPSSSRAWRSPRSPST